MNTYLSYPDEKIEFNVIYIKKIECVKVKKL